MRKGKKQTKNQILQFHGYRRQSIYKCLQQSFELQISQRYSSRRVFLRNRARRYCLGFASKHAGVLPSENHQHEDCCETGYEQSSNLWNHRMCCLHGRKLHRDSRPMWSSLYVQILLRILVEKSQQLSDLQTRGPNCYLWITIIIHCNTRFLFLFLYFLYSLQICKILCGSLLEKIGDNKRIPDIHDTLNIYTYKTHLCCIYCKNNYKLLFRDKIPTQSNLHILQF